MPIGAEVGMLTLETVHREPWAMEQRAMERLMAFLHEGRGAVSDADVQAHFGAAAKTPPAAGQGVAVVPIYGVLFGRFTKNVRQSFRAAMESDAGTVLLDVDSPGGSVYGIDELAAEIYAGRAQKKIVAQVNPFAASAAYYLASQAHEIAITPTGEAGSVGVWMAHIDASKMFADYGWSITLISAGKYKVEGHPFGPLPDEAREFMQSRVDQYYEMFLAAVARGRGASVKDVRAGYGEGRMLGAPQAVAIGLADQVATLEQTFARLSSFKGLNPASAEKPTTEVPVSNPTPGVAAGAETTEAVRSEQQRSGAIVALVQRHAAILGGDAMQFAASAIGANKTTEQVRQEILDKYQSSARPTPQPAAEEATERGSGPRLEIVREGTEVYGAKRDAGHMVARAARALAYGGKDLRKAQRFAEEVLKDKYLAAAMGASEGSSGGFLLQEQVSEDFIELLRPRAVVRSLNPVLAPLVNGALTMHGLASGATATYIGENAKSPSTGVKTRQAKFSSKFLSCLVPISQQLVAYTGGRADTIVREDILTTVALKEDVSFIRSLGTEFSPKGLRYFAPAANVFSANATVNLANVTSDLFKAIDKLEAADCRMVRPGWIMNPRTKNYLMSVRDSNGNFVFQAEMLRGTLLGYPFRTTTQVPKNLGGGSDESEVYLADFADVVIAEAPGIRLSFSDEASYDDGTGLIVSAFQNNQVLIKVDAEHDLNMRHVESIVVITAVKWIP